MTAKAKEIGKKIKKLRREQEMTQQQFAKAIGARQYMISSWESGKSLVSTEYLFKIHSRFAVSLQYFEAAV